MNVANSFLRRSTIRYSISWKVLLLKNKRATAQLRTTRGLGTFCINLIRAEHTVAQQLLQNTGNIDCDVIIYSVTSRVSYTVLWYPKSQRKTSRFKKKENVDNSRHVKMISNLCPIDISINL